VFDASSLEFTCSSERLPGDSYVVRLCGELDLYTAPQLENELETLIRAGAEHVLVDLTDVPFLDSSGLAVLLGAAGRLGRESFALTGLGRETRRVLEITGTDGVLTVIEESREVPA
jgi:anti-sigma B factor antagonist